MAIPMLPTASSVLGGIPLIKDIAQVAKGVGYAATFIKNVRSLSPTQATASNTVISRAYVEESLAHADITPNLLKAGQSMYAGIILQLLQRGNEIASGVTVGTALNKVYTSGMGMESFTNVGDAIDADATALDRYTPSMEGLDDKKPKPTGASIESDAIGSIAPPDLLPVGQVLSVTLSGRDESGRETKHDVVLAVRVTPYVVNSAAMHLILEQGYKPRFGLRWMQWKAGEISFFKDLIFQTDRIRRMEDAIRKDKTGAYAAYLRDTSHRDRDRIMDIFYNVDKPEALSNNLANSIIVISADLAKRVASETGQDITKEQYRRRFFAGSYAMMIFVVDENYHTIDLYINGYSEVRNFSFSDFAPKKKSDPAEFLQLLSAVGGGARPSRF